jgi:hypothetical protein
MKKNLWAAKEVIDEIYSDIICQMMDYNGYQGSQ